MEGEGCRVEGEGVEGEGVEGRGEYVNFLDSSLGLQNLPSLSPFPPSLSPPPPRS